MINCSDSSGKKGLLIEKDSKWAAKRYEKIVLSNKGLRGKKCRV